MNSKFTRKFFIVSVLILVCTSIAFPQTKITINPSQDEQYAWMFIVFAGASTNFYALDSICRKIREAVNEKYTNDLVYDKERGMIVSDSSNDEIYAGNFSPRRYPEERISIEMLWYYADSASSISNSDKRMTIITGIFENKSEAQENLKKIRQVVPDAYIKRIELYMGCMH